MILFNINNSHFIGHMLLDNPALFGRLDTDTDAMFTLWRKHKGKLDYFANRTKDSETPKDLITLTMVVRAPAMFNYSSQNLQQRILNLLYVWFHNTRLVPTPFTKKFSDAIKKTPDQKSKGHDIRFNVKRAIWNEPTVLLERPKEIERRFGVMDMYGFSPGIISDMFVMNPRIFSSKYISNEASADNQIRIAFLGHMLHE